MAELINEAQNLDLRLKCATPFTQNNVQEAFYEVPIPEGYNLIYRENAGRLGCLAAQEAANVVRFYQLIQSVLAHVTEGGYLVEGTRNPRKIMGTVGVLQEALRIGNELISNGR